MQDRIDEIGRVLRRIEPVAYPVDEADRRLQPAVDMAALFCKRLDALRAPDDSDEAVVRVRDGEAAAAHLRRMCDGVPPEEIVWQGEPMDEVRDRAVGISWAAAMIAATGSVILELAVGAEGAASLLVDRHIVIGDLTHLMPDIATFYRRLGERFRAENSPNDLCGTGLQPVPSRVAGPGSENRDPEHGISTEPSASALTVRLPGSIGSGPLPDGRGSDWTSRICAGGRLPIQVCITGCSRTADIEKLLVIPAHGPRCVRVILSDSPLDWDRLRQDARLMSA